MAHYDLYVSLGHRCVYFDHFVKPSNFSNKLLSIREKIKEPNLHFSIQTNQLQNFKLNARFCIYHELPSWSRSAVNIVARKINYEFMTSTSYDDNKIMILTDRLTDCI